MRYIKVGEQRIWLNGKFVGQIDIAAIESRISVMLGNESQYHITYDAGTKISIG
jgi:hypothetical protein